MVGVEVNMEAWVPSQPLSLFRFVCSRWSWFHSAPSLSATRSVFGPAPGSALLIGAEHDRMFGWLR